MRRQGCYKGADPRFRLGGGDVPLLRGVELTSVLTKNLDVYLPLTTPVSQPSCVCGGQTKELCYSLDEEAREQQALAIAADIPEGHAEARDIIRRIAKERHKTIKLLGAGHLTKSSSSAATGESSSAAGVSECPQKRPAPPTVTGRGGKARLASR